MKQIRVLALADSENSARLESLLDRENVNRMALLAPVKMNLERAASLPVDGVVLGTSELSEKECAFLEQLYLQRTDLAVIVLTPAADAALLERAMGCGVSRVLTYGVSSEELCSRLEEEITRIRSRAASVKVEEYDSRVVAVFSAKGGAGKTTMATNLAVSLQNAGKKVALLDFNLEFGDVGIFLNLPKCETVADLAEEEKITSGVVNNYLFRYSNGLKVLCAPPSPEYAELIHPEHIERIVTVLRAEYDYLIFDMASAFNECMLAALEQADVIYTVTNPEIPTLKDTRVCLEVLKTLDYFHKVKLILNKAGDSYISGKDVENALEMKASLVVPSDIKACISAVNRGIPVVTASPRSKMSRAIIKYVSEEAV